MGLFGILMSSFLGSLCILEISTLSDVGLVKIFSHAVGCCFVLLTVSFALQKLLSFRRSYLLIIALSVCATGVIFRKWSPVPMHSRILPTFSFYWVQYNWIYVEVFGPLEFEFCARKYIWIFLHSPTC